MSSNLFVLDSDQFDSFNQFIQPDLASQSSSLSTLQSHDPRPRKRPRKAWIWKHMPDDDPETLYYDNKSRVQWRCRYCDTSYLESGGTTVIQNHLVNKHDKRELSTQGQKALRVQASITAAFERASEVNHSRRRHTTALDPAQFEYLFVRWVARCSIPFRMVECEEFRAMAQYINDTCDEWLPQSHNKVREWLFVRSTTRRSILSKAFSLQSLIRSTFLVIYGHLQII